MPIEIRPYEPSDEDSWPRRRALSCLSTGYYDDVWTERPATPLVPLVAMHEGTVVGILDVEVDEELATVDTVATHPDHQNRSIASELLARALDELPAQITVLDAWTREDESALAWYRARGFRESEPYLHVYKQWDETGEGWGSPERLSTPITTFCHAAIEDEEQMRRRFSRVYVCRRFSRSIARNSPDHQ